jgi:hypothetical protein
VGNKPGWILFVDDNKSPFDINIRSRFPSLKTYTTESTLVVKTLEDAKMLIKHEGMPVHLYLDGYLGPGEHGQTLLSWLKSNYREEMKQVWFTCISDDRAAAVSMEQFVSDVWGSSNVLN